MRSVRTMAAISIGFGGWRGPGFEYYLSLRDDEDPVIRDLTRSVDGGIDSSESEEDGDGFTTPGGSENRAE